MMSPDKDAEGRSIMYFNAASRHSTNVLPHFVGDNSSMLQVEGCIIDTIDGGLLGLGPSLKKVGGIADSLDFFKESEYTAKVHNEFTVIGEE